MKIMMEHGAAFGEMMNEELSLDIENQFLKNKVPFEEQFSNERKPVMLFDRIGRPEHFRPADEIPDDAIGKAWDELDDYLNEHGIDLDACSPNVTKKELYRFTVEELFKHEMDDMDLPGWTTNFIYDKFHPDPVHNNSRLVQENLFRGIFRKDELFYEIDYDDGSFVFNKKFLEKKLFIEKINHFKSLFDEIELKECIIKSCVVNEKDCRIEGNYKATAKTSRNEMIFSGIFVVELVLSDMVYWNFKKIRMDGFNPE